MYILVLKGRRRHVVWLGVCWIFNIISINNKNRFFSHGLVKLNKRVREFIYMDDNVQERSSKISIYNKGGENRLRHPV